MQRSFLQSYLEAFHQIQGWFSYDAALLFMAYNRLAAAAGIQGDSLEIGVYHGLSAIAVAKLRGPGSRFYAIDLFEHLQSDPGYGSGTGYRKIFESNMRAFFEQQEFIVPVASASGTLRASDFSTSFSFCHVDGGHSPRETYDDLNFASEILMPGGLLALDDYFNPQHPGVCEGALEFARERPGVLRPLAIGYNKVLFQKTPGASAVNERFSAMFPAVTHLSTVMWAAPVFLFRDPLRTAFDLYASTPELLVPLGSAGIRAVFLPERQRLQARRGKTVSLPVVVRNTSGEEFPAGESSFGLSYHLLSQEGETLAHDNARAYFTVPLPAGERRKVNLEIAAPLTSGTYRIEIDLIWEGVMWFKDVGNPTCSIAFEVR